jgi:hypothetical protein
LHKWLIFKGFYFFRAKNRLPENRICQADGLIYRDKIIAIGRPPQYLTQIEPRLQRKQEQGQTDESTDGCANNLGRIAVLAE